MFEYFLFINMNEEPLSVQAVNEPPSPQQYLNPHNFIPEVTLAVYGVVSASKMKNKELTIGEMVEQELAVPLAGFHARLFLAQDLVRHNFSPRTYIKEVLPAFADLPSDIVPLQEEEPDAILDDFSNLFLIEEMELPDGRGLKYIQKIIDCLQLQILSHFHVTVEYLIFASPPIPLLLASEPFQKSEELSGLLKNLRKESDKVIFIDAWQDPQTDDDTDPEEDPRTKAYMEGKTKEKAEYACYLSAVFMTLGFVRPQDPEKDYLIYEVDDYLMPDFHTE